MDEQRAAALTQQYLIDYARLLETSGQIAAASQLLDLVNWRAGHIQQPSNVVPIR